MGETEERLPLHEGDFLSFVFFFRDSLSPLLSHAPTLLHVARVADSEPLPVFQSPERKPSLSAIPAGGPAFLTSTPAAPEFGKLRSTLFPTS